MLKDLITIAINVVIIAFPLWALITILARWKNELHIFLLKRKVENDRKIISKKGETTYLLGIGLIQERMYEEAHKYLLYAANKDHPEALYELANLYCNNLLQKEDDNDSFILAMNLVQRAATLGSSRAVKFLNEYKMDFKDLYSKTQAWMEKLKEAGLLYPEGEDELSELMDFCANENFTADKLKQFSNLKQLKKFEKHAKEGNELAMLAMAKAYKEGTGTTISYIDAYLWSKLSLEKGCDDAALLVNDLESFLMNKQDLTKAQELYPGFMYQFS